MVRNMLPPNSEQGTSTGMAGPYFQRENNIRLVYTKRGTKILKSLIIGHMSSPSSKLGTNEPRAALHAYLPNLTEMSVSDYGTLEYGRLYLW